MKSLLRKVAASRWVSVTFVLVERRDLHVGFDVYPVSVARPPEPWLVSCLGVREFSLRDFDGGGLNFWTGNHPLLSQYTSPKASLRVRVSRETREMVTGVLLLAHTDAVGDWIDFDRFIRVERVFRGDGGSATLSGPRFLMEAYAASLAAADIGATLKRHKRRLYWDGIGWSERRYRLSLLHFGDSFVAAERFTAAPFTSRRPLRGVE